MSALIACLIQHSPQQQKHAFGASPSRTDCHTRSLRKGSFWVQGRILLQAALMFLWLVEIAGLVLTFEEFGQKIRDGDGAFKDRSWTIVNTVFGCLCFALLSCAVCMYAWRCYNAHRLGKRW